MKSIGIHSSAHVLRTPAKACSLWNACRLFFLVLALGSISIHSSAHVLRTPAKAGSLWNACRLFFLVLALGSIGIHSSAHVLRTAAKASSLWNVCRLFFFFWHWVQSAFIPPLTCFAQLQRQVRCGTPAACFPLLALGSIGIHSSAHVLRTPAKAGSLWNACRLFSLFWRWVQSAFIPPITCFAHLQRHVRCGTFAA